VAGGFKLGGIDASEFGIRLLQGTEINILPETRDMIGTIPGMHGAYDFGAVMDVRNFELKCAMIGARSPEELQQRIRRFVQHLVDANGHPRAIAHRPRVVFADEPTAELDTHTGLQVVKVFKNLVEKEGLTVVMTTHDPSMVEIADRVYTLEDGEIVDEQ